MNTLRALLALCPLLFCACSSSSSGGDVAPMPKSDSGADAGGGSGSSGGSSSGSQAPPPKPANCARGSDCYSCCVADLAGGAQLWRLAELDCVCVGNGSCAQECTSEECALLASNRTTCGECIQARMDGTCAQQASTACNADATCKLYKQCIDGCQ